MRVALTPTEYGTRWIYNTTTITHPVQCAPNLHSTRTHILTATFRCIECVTTAPFIVGLSAAHSAATSAM